MKNQSIKLRIFVILFVLILIPSLFLNYNQFQSTKEQIEAKQLRTLELKMEHVNEVLQNYGDEIKTYALLLAENNMLQEGVNALKDIKKWDYNDPKNAFNYPHDELHDLDAEYYDDRIVSLRNFSRNAFNTLHSEHEYIGNIEVMNQNIVVVMRGHRDKRGDVKKDQLIKDAVAGNSSSGFLLSKRTGQPAIDGTAPIKYGGEIVGGIKIGMYLTESVIKDIEMQTEAKLLIFDGKKAVMTSKYINEDSYMIGMDDRHTVDVFEHIEPNIDNQCTLIKDSIYQNYTLKGAVYTQLYSDGHSSNYAIKIVPIKDYTGAVIGAYMIALDNSVVLTELQEQVQNISIRVLTFLILSIMVSYVFSHQISEPIMQFTHQIVSMGKEDGIKPINYSEGPIELTKLAFEFNVLVDKLHYQRKKNETLEVLNSLDGLTNLFNHKKFHQDIGEVLNEDQELALIFFDLDHFKSINDTLGHSVGDVVLREVSKILKSFERDKEVQAYRYGGEEFAILGFGLEKNIAYKLSEDVRLKIMNSKLLRSLAQDLSVTISAGLATYPHDTSSISKIVEYADFSMYYSKRNGRNKTTQYTSSVKEFFFEHSEDIINKNSLLNSIKMLSNALEARDEYTADHSRRVMMYSIKLANAMGFDTEMKEKLKFASLLHDNGKIGISDSILLKAGQLTTEEYDEVKNHPTIGYNIVKNLSTNEDIDNGILYHHENWDGTGYPAGLQGNEIPIIARIIAIADSFEAMTSDRPYRKALPLEKVIDEIIRNKAIKYDPLLADKFVDIICSEKDFISSNNISKSKSKTTELNFKDNNELKIYQESFDTSLLNIVLLDRDHKILYANDATLDLLGKSADNMVNKQCYQSIIGLTTPCEDCKMDMAFQTKSVQQNYKHEILINGEIQDIIQIWIPILDSDREVGSVLEIAFTVKNVIDYLIDIQSDRVV